MRIDICDVCLAEEKKITRTVHYFKFRPTGLKVFVCDEHTDRVRHLKPEEAMNLLLKAESEIFTLHNADKEKAKAARKGRAA